MIVLFKADISVVLNLSVEPNYINIILLFMYVMYVMCLRRLNS